MFLEGGKNGKIPQWTKIPSKSQIHRYTYMLGRNSIFPTRYSSFQRALRVARLDHGDCRKMQKSNDLCEFEQSRHDFGLEKIYHLSKMHSTSIQPWICIFLCPKGGIKYFIRRRAKVLQGFTWGYIIITLCPPRRLLRPFDSFSPLTFHYYFILMGSS